jgi:RNA polymerase sigma-70 factor (ECF subfamily)
MATVPLEHLLPATSAEEPALWDDAVSRAFVEVHVGFIARVLRGLGVFESDVDDAVQQVFIVAARKLLPTVTEDEARAFLFGVARRIAHRARRTRGRASEFPESPSLDNCADALPGPDALCDQRRARELLDRVMATMPLDLRTVFVLYEVEELSMAEIAKMLELPVGTVASRLRRGRAEFQLQVRRWRARTALRVERE